MDKYTVDLDQVLNDFEYSELTTEQQSANSFDQLPSQQHVKNYSNAKHSINNVFSSLNDYLNSEINENVEYKDNNYDNNVTYQRSTISTVNAAIASETTSEGNPQINKVLASTQESSLSSPKIEVLREKVNIAEENQNLEETTFKHVKNVNATPVKERPLESLIADPILLKIDDSINSFEESPENLENAQILNEINEIKDTFLCLIGGRPDEIVNSAQNETKETQILNEIKEIKGAFLCSISDRADETETNNEIVNSAQNETSNAYPSQLAHVQTDDLLKNHIETFDSFVNDETNFTSLHDELNSFTENVIQQEDLVTNVEITKNDESTSCNSKLEAKDENCEGELKESGITQNTTDLSCDKIGFHVEVDDEEAAKYLEELDDLLDEDEMESETFHDVPGENMQELHENNEYSVQNEQNFMIKDREYQTIRGNTVKVEISGVDLQENIEILGNVEVLKTGDDKHRKIAQVKRGEISQEIVVENDEACGNANIVNIVDGSESRVRIKLAESAETLRPNSLDIKDVKETVNIIGNPGSTPYNNLYVSKEVTNVNINTNSLNPHATLSSTTSNVNKSQNYESESSTSVSPTFSEASTDSVHSTDSPILNKKTGNQENNNTQENDNETHGNDNVNDTNEEDEHENDENVTATEDAPPATAILEDEENLQEITVIARIAELSDDVACHHPISEEEDVYVDLDSINHEPVQGCSETVEQEQTAEDALWLGKRAPVWIPDADALSCQHCELKFTVIKRRHHCRACGLVLCSKCCNMKHKLEYLGAERRVCTRCYELLNRETDSGSGDSQHSTPNRDVDAVHSASGQPNPNNPMEYCSVVPPHQQVEGGDGTPPSVMVPVGVLKRKGSNKKHNKSVMFCDGIRPGSDLTNLDNDFNYNDNKKRASTSQTQSKTTTPQQATATTTKVNKNLPVMDHLTRSFIPTNENRLPPTVTTYKSDITYTECGNNANVVEMLQNETLTFAVQRNLHIHVRLINMDCCVNKQAWCFSTEGLISVGQDEIVILLEYMDNETQVPKDIFYHLNNIYNSAVKGTTVTELGLSLHPTKDFLDSRNHAGFIFVRPSFQCLQNVIVPKEPYLVGVLVHRWETPWARIFPLRLVLRLGAEYRYYPSPLISTRNRDSVFVEIGHTIINLLADFRNFSYTLPNIRGLTIHMEDKSTTVAIPVNRYDQVMKTISNSSEHILAFGGNFSTEADSHLVCIQDTQGSNENSYKTHAINIQNKPRKVTGASFIVFNGALKSSSGLTAKSSIVEDGLMIQIPPEHMIKVRESLRNMKNHTIQCGCVNATSDETVNIVWSDSDVNFNIGVKSSVDGQSLSGVPSIRVHNGKDYTCNSGARLIRWTEVFLLQNGEENARTQDPVDISKVAESISKATCQALVKYLDLLATNSFMKIGIRTTLHVDDVSYSAGSNGTKLPPIYMKSLDNELVPVLHGISSAGNVGDGTIVLELIFRILNV